MSSIGRRGKMERMKVREKQDEGEGKPEQKKNSRMRKIGNMAESLPYRIIFICIHLHQFQNHLLNTNSEIQPFRSWGN